MRAIRVRLLGGIQVSSRENGREQTLSLTPKPIALLAYLAVAGARGRALQRDTLLALFWPELPADRARAALRQAVFHLRRAVGADALRSDRSTIGLGADAVWCDVREFEALIASGERSAALDVYRGDLLEGFFIEGASAELEDWIERERARLKRAARDACAALADEADRLGSASAAALWARRAAMLAPDDEIAVRRHLLMLARSGDRAGALRVAEDFARYLAQEFGATWSAETEALVAALRMNGAGAAAQSPPAAPAAKAAAASADMPAVESAGAPPPPSSGAVPRRGLLTGWAPAVAAWTVVALLVATGLVVARTGHGAMLPAGQRATGAPAITIRSPVARRLYEEALGRYADDELGEALRLLDAALAEDTTCAMCAYYAGKIEGEEGDTAARHTLGRAMRLASGASSAERMLIRFEWLDFTNSPGRLAVAESLAARYPGWLEAQLADGQALLMASQYAAATGHLRAVVASGALPDTGSGRCPRCIAERELVAAYVYADSLDAAIRTAEQWTRLQPRARAAWFDLSHALARAARFDEARAALDSSTRYGVGSNEDAVERAQIEIDAGNFATADAMLETVAQTGNAASRLDAYWWLDISLRTQGRLREALAIAQGPMRWAEAAIDEAAPNAAALAEAQVLYEFGDYRRAATIFGGIALARAPAVDGEFARQHTWQSTHVGSALAAAGDTAGLVQVMDTVEYWGRRSGLTRDQHLGEYLQGLLWMARRRPDSAAVLFRRALVFSETDGFSRLNYQLARSLLSLGRAREAIPVIRHALEGNPQGGNLYLTRTELQELLAQAYDAASQPDSAASYYRRVVQAWRRADAPFQSRVARARARLAVDERRLVALR
jgi:serine/threonine-protein kinase